jgi:hypothetical protein
MPLPLTNFITGQTVVSATWLNAVDNIQFAVSGNGLGALLGNGATGGFGIPGSANFTAISINGTPVTPTGAVNANSLTGTTLAAGVVNSSLTSVGTLTALSVTGTGAFAAAITVGTSVTAASASISGLAAVGSLTVGGGSVFSGVPQSASTTIAVTDNGKCIVATGTIIVPNAVMAAGNAVSIYNNSAAAISLTATITTLRLAGTATTGTRTLAQRGICTIWFLSGTEAIVSGSGVT